MFPSPFPDTDELELLQLLPWWKEIFFMMTEGQLATLLRRALVAPLPLFAGTEWGVPLRCHPEKIQQNLRLL